MSWIYFTSFSHNYSFFFLGANVIATYRGDSVPAYLSALKEGSVKGSLHFLEMDVGSENSILTAGKNFASRN